jgi:tRNA (adenine22-N1)-methyltransferase
VLGLLLPCELLADVGTDHALIPIAAVSRGLAQRAIASDLREAPLRGAKRNVERAALQDRVTLVHGDGLTALEGLGVDAVAMAGLSGASMERLCRAAPSVLASVRQLVLQPNQNVDTLRAWALRSGWHLRDEILVEERERLFVSCVFVPGRGEDPAYRLSGCGASALCTLGPLLLSRKDPLARAFYRAQRARLTELIRASTPALGAELATYRAACDYMDSP